MFLDRIKVKLNALFRKNRAEQEMDEELRYHLDKQIEFNLSSGMNQDEARREAIRFFGGVDQMKEQCRDARGVRVLENLWQDIRFATRLLIKRPAFTAMSVIALALGIGGNSAIFSVVNAVLLRPLPYKNPNQLIAIQGINAQDGKTGLSIPDFVDVRNENQIFSAVALYERTERTLTDVGEPERLKGQMVTSDFFAVFAVQPLIGGLFTTQEDTRVNVPPLILSHELWQRRFGSDPGLMGKTITLDGDSFQVVGVMPASFDFPKGSQFWTPAGPTLVRAAQYRNLHIFNYVIGRLQPNISPAQGRTVASTISRRLAEQHPDSNKGWDINLVPLKDQMIGDVRSSLYILMGAVAAVLLIAALNVIALQLAQATVRQKEMAIRAALGAGRSRLVRQLLVESTILGLLGGALGLLLANWGVKFLVTLNSESIARVEETKIDIQVLLFTIGISLIAGLGFGLVPALQASKTDLNNALKDGGQSSAVGKRIGFNLLIVSEFALSLTLLIGAGLLINSFMRLQRVDLGFNPENVLTMQVNLPSANKYSPRAAKEFYQQLIDRISVSPGVKAVGLVSDLPLNNRTGALDAWKQNFPEQTVKIDFEMVSPDYFKTVGTQLSSGRALTNADNADSTKVAIINESLSTILWPNEDPIGKVMTFQYFTGPETVTVQGVVKDIRNAQLAKQPSPAIYVSYLQVQSFRNYIVIRTTNDPLSFVAATRTAVWELDKDQPIDDVETLDRHVFQASSKPRFYTVLMAVFAGLALLLAVVGIYGVISYSVSQQTHEIGIRMALGAQASDVLKLTMRHGITLTLVGVLLGLAASVGLTRVLASFLYQVTAFDLATFVSVTVLLSVIAILACYVPARRATRIDPLLALRRE